MDHKVLASARVVLVVLAIAAVTSAALPASAQAPVPPAGSGFLPENSLSDPVFTPTSSLVSMPDPILPSGMPTPLAPTALSSDDRDESIPTAWYILARQTPSQVTDTISSGYRLVDIYVESFSPTYRFTGVYVANSDAYAKSCWWYYGLDEAALNYYLGENNARLISLKAYDIGSGQIRFTAVMIGNTGADATTWWWYANATPEDITDLIDDNEARLTQIHAYQTGGLTRYAVVMVDNTGAAGKGWWWYINATVADVSSLIQANNARLVDMDIDPVTGKLAVIMNSCASGCPYWWWFVNIPEEQLLDVVNQYGARVIDVNDHPGCGSTCYDLVLINNSNAITTRVGERLRSGTDGTKGLYLEEVGGPVLANLMNDYTFEPASTLKAAVHLHAVQQIRDNPGISLSTLIPKYQPPPAGESCPGNTIIGSESIETADREMMWHSDNTRTRELVDFFTEANINSLMTSIGMADSSINHVFGCGGPIPNQTTLNDLATLYRGVANGTLLGGYYAELFCSQMAGTAQFAVEGQDWTHLVDDDIPAIIDDEAPTWMPTAWKNAFEEDIFLAYKAGDYKICTNNDCSTYLDHISIFGYAQIPFCGLGGPRQYVFGMFIANATSDDNSSDTFEANKAELLREQIRAGLASCFHQIYLPLIVR
jgi:hypothetical protein